MDKKSLVKIINTILREPWSDLEVKNGKDLQCMSAWTPTLKEIIPLYLEKGWIVQKKLEITSRGRHLFLNFKNPSWKKEKNKTN